MGAERKGQGLVKGKQRLTTDSVSMQKLQLPREKSVKQQQQQQKDRKELHWISGEGAVRWPRHVSAVATLLLHEATRTSPFVLRENKGGGKHRLLFSGRLNNNLPRHGQSTNVDQAPATPHALC